MNRNTKDDLAFKQFVDSASDGTLLARPQLKFWFVPELPIEYIGARAVCAASGVANKAIRKAAALNACEIARRAITKASK